MIKFLTICFFSLGFFCASAQSSRCYELRIYYCEPGRLDALVQRFTNHTTKLFEKHGMKNEGYWLPIDNQKNALYYVLSFPNRTARDMSWKAFIADSVWKKVQTESELSGKIITRIESIILNETDYSPIVHASIGAEGRVFELRTYKCMPQKLQNVNARFRDYTRHAFTKYGMTNIAYWNTVEPNDTIQPKLVYMLAHNSPEAAKASFDAFRADPEKIKIFTASEANGKLVDNIESVFLKPLPFSAIK
jgi:hypothetical protein